MTALTKKKRLHKELGLFDVYAVATGATLSAGFFLLPGLAAAAAGPGLVLAYLVAVIPLVPATFSVLELATAMPRAGGVYYFIDRSLGPAFGAVGGLGTWFALLLKVAFALVGMGAYIALFAPGISITPTAIALAVGLGAVNLLGARKSGRFQSLLVLGLLAILAGFVGAGLPRIEAARFEGLLDAGYPGLLATAGLVYISYVGVTKVASLSEEVRDPERNLPLGVFLALGTALVVYVLGTVVMVGVVPMERLAGDLTPVATAAEGILGDWGVLLVSLAAFIAFVSVANAGTLASSRYPLAMSRDKLLPRFFQHLTARRTPWIGVVTSVGLIVAMLLAFDPTGIAKLASAFQLLMFALVCLAVIVMRESRIEAYDPGYRSPLYPWMQIAGIVAPLVLIFEMGWLPILFSLGMVVVAVGWYVAFARGRIGRSGAIYHLLARLAEQRLDSGLEVELRHILREKGLREEDPFDHVVAEATAIDLDGRERVTFEELVERVSSELEGRVPATAEELATGFFEGTRIGATMVSNGVSLPHLRLFELEQPQLVLVRARRGVFVDVTDVHGEHSPEQPVYCLFFLVSPEEDPKQHLRILAQFAERVDDDDFLGTWLGAANEQVLKEILLRDERFLSLRLEPDGQSGRLSGRPIRDLELPEGVLVALVRRGGEIAVPHGKTVLRARDRLTIIGTPPDIRRLQREYVN